MRKKLLLVLTISCATSVFAQVDSLPVAVLSESKSITNAGEPIFNGREHISYHPSIEGEAYYQSNDWQPGVLVYQRVPYKDVYLKYDEVADELIVRHPNGYMGVVLFTPRLQSFLIGNKRFVILAGDGSGFQGGIYEELQKGKLSLYAKRSKIIRENLANTGIEKKFIKQDSYYVQKDGKFFPVKREKDIMKLVQDKKDAIEASLREAGLKYNAFPEAALIKIVADYNQLSR